VGVSAVEAALSITSAAVLFTGLDFSYPRQQTHARSAPFHLGMLRSCSRLRPCGMILFETLLARPRLWLHDKGGNRLLTDLVLQSYARQLREVSTNIPRCFDLSAQGLPVGAERVDTISELTTLCSQTADTATRQANAAASSGRRPEPSCDTVQRFCRREQELLYKAVQSMAGSNRIPSEAAGPVEYLYLSIPEVNPDRTLSPQNLSRVERLAEKCRLYLQRTRMALMGGQ
jgi:hypothetical protein